MSVNDQNFLSKFCFCVIGSGLDKSADELKAYLLKRRQFNENNNLPVVGRPTIYGWFSGQAVSKVGSFEFFLSSLPTNEELTDPDRKKVARQVRSYCTKRIPSRPKSNIRGALDGWIHLKGEDRFKDDALVRELAYYVGVYRVIKARSGAEVEATFSREYFEIARSGASLSVDWWYLVDGDRVEKFEGNAYFMGDWMWFALYSPALRGRFRHVCIDGRSWGRRNPELRGGIILSSSPHAVEPRPTATRFVVEPRPKDLASPDEESDLGHITAEQIDSPNKDQIVQFIEESLVTAGRLDAHLNLL